MSEANPISGSAIRPWRTFFETGSFSLPPFSYNEAITRVSLNLRHFSANYTTIVIFFTFITIAFNADLLGNSAFVLIFILIVLYKTCSARHPKYPDHCCCLVIDRRHLAIVLLISVAAFLVVWKDATWSFVCVLMVVGALIGVHAVCRRTEDLYLDEETARDESIAVVTDLETQRDDQTSIHS